MASISVKSSYPGHIPVEPVVYKLMSMGFCDEKLKESMFQAVERYNRKCERAYRKLLRELEECLKQNK